MECVLFLFVCSRHATAAGLELDGWCNGQAYIAVKFVELHILDRIPNCYNYENQHHFFRSDQPAFELIINTGTGSGYQWLLHSTN